MVTFFKQYVEMKLLYLGNLHNIWSKYLSKVFTLITTKSISKLSHLSTEAEPDEIIRDNNREDT